MAAPRDSAIQVAERLGAGEHRSERIRLMRERGAETATTHLGRMGAEDPARLAGHTLHMPIYEYRCEECGKRSSTLLMSYSSPDPACPHCGKRALRRLVSTFATAGSSDSDSEGDFGGGDDDFGGGDDGGDFDGDDDF